MPRIVSGSDGFPRNAWGVDGWYQQTNIAMVDGIASTTKLILDWWHHRRWHRDGSPPIDRVLTFARIQDGVRIRCWRESGMHFFSWPLCWILAWGFGGWYHRRILAFSLRLKSGCPNGNWCDWWKRHKKKNSALFSLWYASCEECSHRFLPSINSDPTTNSPTHTSTAAAAMPRRKSTLIISCWKLLEELRMNCMKCRVY